MMNSVPAAPIFGDADFFESLLDLERNANDQLDMPAPLQELVEAIFVGLENEGAPVARQKAKIIPKNLIEASTSRTDSLVFERWLPSVHQLIVIDQGAVILLAGLLLGQKHSVRSGPASPIECEIVEGFLTQARLAFSKGSTPQAQINGSHFIAASLPLTGSGSGPAVIVLANRRGETSNIEAAETSDLAQQRQLRQAIGKGLCNVDFVMDAGQVSLAVLKSLKPGSVLPLNQLEPFKVQGKANGAPILNGAWQFSADKMRVTITDVMAGKATKND